MTVRQKTVLRVCGYYNLSLASIILIALTANGDMAVLLTRSHPHVSSRVSILSANLLIIGFRILIMLFILTALVTYPPNLQNTLGSTIQFVCYCGLMFCLIYDPGFYFRLLIEDDVLKKLDSSKFINDIPPCPCPCTVPARSSTNGFTKT